MHAVARLAGPLLLVLSLGACMPRQSQPEAFVAPPPASAEPVMKPLPPAMNLGTVGTGPAEIGGLMPDINAIDETPVVITSAPSGRQGSAWDGPVTPPRR